MGEFGFWQCICLGEGFVERDGIGWEMNGFGFGDGGWWISDSGGLPQIDGQNTYPRSGLL